MRVAKLVLLTSFIGLYAAVSHAEAPSRIDERLGVTLPVERVLQTVSGERVALKDVLHPKRATILTFVYFRCPGACTLLLNGLTKAIEETQFVLGSDYDIITISIDPNESSDLARGKRDTYVQTLNRSGIDVSRWQFFTADRETISQLTDAVGFRYVYEADTMQYTHPSALMFLNDQGTVVRYLYGSYFKPLNVDLALIESGDGAVGSLQQRLTAWFHDFGGPDVGRRYDLNHTRVLLVSLFGFGLLASLLWLVVVRRNREGP